MVSIFARTLIIYIILNISIKVMGKRQIGELDVSELVCTLLISEIAAIPIDDPDLPLMNAIIPILFILSLEIIISSAKMKSSRIKRCVEGESTFVIFKGRLMQSALADNRISINELLSELRTQGVGNIKTVDYALLEQGGKISVLKNEASLPVAHPLIIDGVIKKSEIAMLGYTVDEIIEMLGVHKSNIEEIFLMTLDDNKNAEVIIKEEK